jgi:undecaprenyl pyrophosphate synthase
VDHNWQKVADHAHKISAPCRHVGANILYKQIKDIENFSRNEKETDSIMELYRNACKEFELIETEFKKELLK